MARTPISQPTGRDPFARELTVRQRTEREVVRPTQTLIIHAPADTTVGTSATTLYTVPEERFFRVEKLLITNPTGGNETVSLYIVPDGGSAGTDNAVIHDESLSTNSRLTLTDALMLPPEATLEAKTSTSGGVNITFWGYEIEGGLNA